jgi:hypothetical protein
MEGTMPVVMRGFPIAGGVSYVQLPCLGIEGFETAFDLACPAFVKRMNEGEHSVYVPVICSTRRRDHLGAVTRPQKTHDPRRIDDIESIAVHHMRSCYHHSNA